jgi:mannitol-1-phosphate/altronate dehydrogenase
MAKKKHSITAGRATVASIHKEMQKPRLTASVRSQGRDQIAPLAKQPGTDSQKKY